jgi:hypothetical protein
MRWKRRKEEERSDPGRYEDKARDRLRGIGELQHASRHEDARLVEARLRNMVYGTNRE